MTPEQEQKVQQMMQMDQMALPVTPTAGYGSQSPVQSTQETNPLDIVLNPAPEAK